MDKLQSFLIVTGRTLSQMALYSPDHPSVKGAVNESFTTLNSILNESRELVISTHDKKLIINGAVPEGLTQSALRPFLTLLESHGLHSLTFLEGMTLAEMIPFFRLAQGAEFKKLNLDAAAFLNNQHVTHLKLNEARYAKIGEDESIGKEWEVGPAPGGGSESGREEFANLSLNDLIKKLVDKAVTNPDDRGHIFGRAMDLVKKQIDTAVEKVVVEFNREKTRLTNEQVRTEGVVEAMADGVVVVDESGRVLMMNPAAETIYGVKLGETLGKPLWEGVREEQMISLAKDLSVPTDRSLTKEIQIMGSAEVKKTLRASSAAVQDTNGRIVGLVSILSDVTKQKELTRLQNEFMANVTHDLRAPIHAVKLAMGAILEGTAGPVTNEQTKMLGLANRNVERLSRLIDDLLDFSRVEAGQMEIRPQVFEIEPLLREAVVSMESWSKSRNVRVLFEEGPEVQAVFADSDRILQVVNNLISNAIKFTPAGGKITIRAKQTQDSGKPMVSVEVEDSGQGISKEDQKRIFDRFVQLVYKEKLDIRGTGLGLSICKALVELHKGKLVVQSPPPGSKIGSLFSFTLPSVEKSSVGAGLLAPASQTPAAKLGARKGFWKKIISRFKAVTFLVLLGASAVQARPFHGSVRRVLDSDIIQLQDGTRVRYLGVSGPRKGSPYHTEAVAASKFWVLGKDVRFEYGLQERDADGVWQAYVFADGVFVNEELVKQGLALVSRLPNKEDYLPRLIAAERYAHSRKQGQWRDSALETYPIRMQKGKAP